MNTTTTPMIAEALLDAEPEKRRYQSHRKFMIHRPDWDSDEQLSVDVRPFLRDGSRDFDPDNPVKDSVLIDLRAEDYETRLSVTVALSPAEALTLAEHLIKNAIDGLKS